MPTVDAGHWISLEDGRHILIKDSLGSGTGFSRAALHRKLVAHHEELHGTGGYSHALADEWEKAGRGHSQTVFHKELPGEVKRYLEGHRAATRLFRVTTDAAKAGGADAMGDLGEDKYFGHIDKMSGSNVKAALETARGSDDPEMRFLAAVHDHLPDAGARKNIGTIAPNKLKVGQRFTAGGIPVRVVEDADGFKVLSGIGDDVPLDALKQVPVDRGSLKMSGGKVHMKRSGGDDIAPFSAADGTATDARWMLNLSAQLQDATMPAQDMPTESFGQPIKYGWADALVCGSYTHPTTGQRFTIDRKRLDNSVAAFNQMQANGVRPAMVEDHVETAAKSLGWVAGARRNGDKLQLLHAVVGADAHLKASRNLISVKLCGTFKDARGNTYTDAITHSALTPVPVIPGQAGFIAASSGPAATPHTDGNVPDVFILAAPSTPRRLSMPFTAEQLNRIRQFPGAAKVTDDGAADFLLSFADTKTTEVQTAVTRATTAETQLAAANEKLGTSEAKVVELSAAVTATTTPKKPEAEVLDTLAEGVEGGIDSLVSQRKLNLSAATKLKAVLVGTGKDRNAICLSRTMTGTPVSLARSVIEALKDNVQVPATLLDEATAAQLELSAATDPKKGDATAKDAAAVTSKMIQMANGGAQGTEGMAKMCRDKK